MVIEERPCPVVTSPQEGEARLRALLEALRRARIGEIRAIEEYLGVAPARPEREQGRRDVPHPLPSGGGKP